MKLYRKAYLSRFKVCRNMDVIKYIVNPVMILTRNRHHFRLFSDFTKRQNSGAKSKHLLWNRLLAVSLSAQR